MFLIAFYENTLKQVNKNLYLGSFNNNFGLSAAFGCVLTHILAPCAKSMKESAD